MHNVAKEFSADDIFEMKASIAHKMAKRMKKDALGGQTDKDQSKIELVVAPPKETTVGETETKKDGDGEWAV
jgi:hypothetical protein